MIRLAVRVKRPDAELVLSELLGLARSGVEETEVAEDIIEFAVYGAPGELPELPDLRAAAGSALVEISTSVLPDDWSERWKQFHHPILIDSPAPDRVPGLHVRPPWEAARADTGAAVHELVIDPGQAFGTGAHATTRLCLELLLELAARDPERGPLLDVGTGSGVLAIAAAQLGFAPVLGLDHEHESVEAAQENAAENHVSIEVRRWDLRADPIPAVGDRPGGLPWAITANLLRPLLLDLARALPSPPPHLIASGLLVGEVEEIVAAFAAHLGMREDSRRTSGEWAAVWLLG